MNEAKAKFLRRDSMNMSQGGNRRVSLKKIKYQVKVLQASEIKHGHVQALCMLNSRLIDIISRLCSGLVD